MSKLALTTAVLFYSSKEAAPQAAFVVAGPEVDLDDANQTEHYNLVAYTSGGTPHSETLVPYHCVTKPPKEGSFFTTVAGRKA